MKGAALVISMLLLAGNTGESPRRVTVENMNWADADVIVNCDNGARVGSFRQVVTNTRETKKLYAGNCRRLIFSIHLIGTSGVAKVVDVVMSPPNVGITLTIENAVNLSSAQWDSQQQVSSGVIYGYTFWPCESSAPLSLVRADLVLQDPLLGMAIAAHEEDHAVFMREHAKDCKGWKSYSESHPREVLDMEARGWCVGEMVLVRSGRVTIQEAVANASESLWKYYPAAQKLGLSRRQVRAMIERYCPVPS